MTILAIRDLNVAYGRRIAVAQVSLTVAAGEVVALVGESGSGKSTIAAAAIGLLPENAQVEGQVRLGDHDLAASSESARARLRGSAAAMVFQEPMTALNPRMRARAQVAETLRAHHALSWRDRRERARAVLARVGVSAEQGRRYPHELSGGQRQRVAIAIAIAAGPRLLIADEPTTALDVTTQAEILALLRRLIDEDGMALLLVSHDLALVAQVADRIIVMKDGRGIEEGETLAVLDAPRHAYTRRLVAQARLTPSARAYTPVPDGGPILLDVREVVRAHGRDARAHHRALDRVTLSVARGEIVGVIGESGAGKTSLVRAVLGLEAPQQGEILLNGQSLLRAGGRARRRMRREVQAVFQDPVGSFDPRHRVETIVSEPLHLLGGALDRAGRRARVVAMLERVGLSAADADRFPHQFSGGERQRIAIARALIVEPSLVVLDEALSALDASVRAEILALLSELSTRSNLAYLFVGHDLAVIGHFTDRLLVMREGRVVEQGRTADILAAPSHPYTASLIAAAPDLDRALAARRGQA